MSTAQLVLQQSRPGALFATEEGSVRASVRSSLRFARVSVFIAETLARHVVDGVSESATESARELRWIAENLVALSGVRPHVVGELPRSPSVMVANHISYLDPLLLAGLVPCVPIAKAELSGWPVLGEAARRSKVLFVRRDCGSSGARVLREAMRALEQGISILVFPEGTTTRGREVLPFRRGAFGLAQMLGVPVVPIAVSYADPEAAWVGDDTFLPHFVRTLARPFTSASVRILPALEPDDCLSASELAELARSSIASALQGSRSASGLQFAWHAQRAVA